MLAAGALVLRRSPVGLEVLVVHRPKYDDWSFPKGKLDHDEHSLVAAVREVQEETGVSARLGPPLPHQRYLVDGESKLVRYWVAQPLDGSGTLAYQANAEVDDVDWLPLSAAATRLTYARDIELLDGLDPTLVETGPLVVLRHAKAQSREAYSGADDKARPLSDKGKGQAHQLRALLGAYGVQRIFASGSLRAEETVQPYARHSGVEVQMDPGWSEEDWDADGVRERVAKLLADVQPTVVCTHRKVLPAIFAALGIDDPRLPAAAFVVLHRDHGNVVALEQHAA